MRRANQRGNKRQSSARNGSCWAISYAGGNGASLRDSAERETAKLTTAPGVATKAEFAARVGLTRGRISQLIAQGLPVRPDGRIDVETDLQWMEDNLDADRGNKGGSQAPVGAPTLAEAKRLHEIVKVQRARLSLDKERGDLVSRAEVKAAVFARARRERKALNRQYRDYRLSELEAGRKAPSYNDWLRQRSA